MCLGLHTGRVVVDRLGGIRSGSIRPPGRPPRWPCGCGILRHPGRFCSARRRSTWCKTTCGSSRRGRPWSADLCAGASVRCPWDRPPTFGSRRPRCAARSPFVGRERELALLHDRLDAVEAGQGQVVALVGEPGIGKSRLLEEYRCSLLGRQMIYAEGHCLSYGSATPYLPAWTSCASSVGLMQESRATRSPPKSTDVCRR